jgi:non-ribosomal peptide synthetase component F
LSIAYNEGIEGLKDKFDKSKKNWPEYLTHLENEKLQKNGEEAQKYWQENLVDASHRVQFSNSKKDSQINNVGKREAFSVSFEAFKKMKKLAFANRTSIFSVLSGFFAAFLNRFYGCEDLIIGYPLNLRPAGFKNSFGFFVNILPLKLTLDGNLTFNELIKRIDQKRRADKKFQYLNSLDIVKAKRKSDPEFDGLMFNVSMAETISRLQNLQLEGIKSTSLDNEKIEIHDDLSFIYELDFKEVKLWLEYREDLFACSDIKIMVKTFQKLIEISCQNPDQKMNEFDLLDKKELKMILQDFNKVKDVKNCLNVVEMFEKQAR